MATDKKKTQRRYNEELKAQVLTECEAPGVSATGEQLEVSRTLEHKTTLRRATS